MTRNTQSQTTQASPWTAQPLDDERRIGLRARVESDIWLLDLEGLTVLRCHTDNLSPGGFWATVPVSSPLAVGQRYEVRARPSDPKTARAVALPYPCFGTIIRTETLPRNESHPDQLGFAIRFDAP